MIKMTIKTTLSVMLILMCLSCGKNHGDIQSIQVIAHQPVLPVLAKKERNQVLKISLEVPDSIQQPAVGNFEFSFDGTTNIGDIASAALVYNKEDNFDEATIVADSDNITPRISMSGNRELDPGKHYFWLSVALNGTPELTHRIAARLLSVDLIDGRTLLPQKKTETAPQRIGIALRQHGDDGVDTYRIPGLATTNKGTLIAVYDVRYNDPVDLQEDIDVGMNRSTDGGQTWEPMKIIMDMGEYGGLDEDQNGIGDPAVLVDHKTNTIWVAALWLHGYSGERAWNASQPGISPKRTGQLILVKSEDDGLTWSKPINITPQVKKEEWQLFFNGPGAGITMKDGTLVFAAQYKDKDRVPHSTIIYSKDGGASWHVGTGAKSETTEAQVVELTDGSLMLNMRDDRNRSHRKDSLNGRSVAVSHDLGKTWTEHPSSRKALIEPNCMASILAHDHPELGKILFFSNPDSETQRNHISIKTSFDEGMTWPHENQLELFENNSYGYSCMTMVDDGHVGILYEGVKELYFQKIPIKELIN